MFLISFGEKAVYHPLTLNWIFFYSYFFLFNFKWTLNLASLVLYFNPLNSTLLGVQRRSRELKKKRRQKVLRLRGTRGFKETLEEKFQQKKQKFLIFLKKRKKSQVFKSSSQSITKNFFWKKKQPTLKLSTSRLASILWVQKLVNVTNPLVYFFLNLYLLTAQRFIKTSNLDCTFTYIKYLQFYIGSLYKIIVFLQQINLLVYLNIYLIYQIIKRFNTYHLQNYSIFYLGAVAELFYFSFAFKEITWIVEWCQYQLTIQHFKKHRRLMFLFFKMVYFVYALLAATHNLCGFYCIFKGKLGLGGSVRKRKMQIRHGTISLSSKHLKVKSQKFSIWTASGSVGAHFFLFFS